MAQKHQEGRPKRLIELDRAVSHPLPRMALKATAPLIERLLAVDVINRVYAEAKFGEDPRSAFRCALDALHAGYSLPEEDLERIPATGPLVVVANHPFGGIEGLVLGDILSRVRPDMRILGNFLLHQIPELRDWVIPVDPFGRRESIAANARGMRQALRFLNDGGVILVFPSGEVSSMTWERPIVTDPAWSAQVAGIIRRTRATALPVFFPGQNGPVFQMAGLIHPLLRTALLPRALANKRFKTIETRIGTPLPWRRLEEIGSDTSLINYLRTATYLLKYRKAAPESQRQEAKVSAGGAEIGAAMPKERLLKEIARLPADRKLGSIAEFAAYSFRAAEAPDLMLEIGREREIAFRAVGEGTGKARDLDRFDEYYDQLLLWDHNQNRLVGAYRLGVVADILPKYGKRGLYTNTLFHFRPKFFDELEGGVELGRSFVSMDYQRLPTSLNLLWRAIGEFAARDSRCRTLFGPVSISKDYNAVSRNLMVRYLRMRKKDDLARLVRARHPFRCAPVLAVDSQALSASLRNVEDVSMFVSLLERDGRGVPILLRQYLKLNATLLSFNVDANFGDVVDGLILVDLLRAEPKVLKRFMGDEGYNKFMARYADSEVQASSIT